MFLLFELGRVILIIVIVINPIKFSDPASNSFTNSIGGNELEFGCTCQSEITRRGDSPLSQFFNSRPQISRTHIFSVYVLNSVEDELVGRLTYKFNNSVGM